jgi:hypothetical protein
VGKVPGKSRRLRVPPDENRQLVSAPRGPGEPRAPPGEIRPPEASPHSSLNFAVLSFVQFNLLSHFSFG